MPRAFEASAEFVRSGAQALHVLEQVATSREPWPVDFKLVKEIHFRWFETTFPVDAGEFRTQMFLNRKGTAVEVEAILPAIDSACGNWNWRRERRTPADGVDLMQFVVAGVNTLTVRVYDVHPFIDGNTRATHDHRSRSTRRRRPRRAQHPEIDLARSLSPAAPRRGGSSRRAGASPLRARRGSASC